MGLLDQITGAIDERKRYYGNIVRGLLDNPAAQLEMLRAQNAENVREQARAAQETRSVMPQIAEPAQRAAFDQAMNMGLLGITVYHGSPHKFDKFDANAPKTTGGSFNKYGASVSPDKKVANRYAKDFGEGGFTYKVDADIKKQLNLSASEFETLQRYVGKIDGGEKLNEVQQISLEMLLEKHGIKSFGHPMKSIKSAGYDAIANDAGRYGSAEREILVFDPQKLKILGIE